MTVAHTMYVSSQIYAPTRAGKSLIQPVRSLQARKARSEPVWSATARTAFRTLACVEALLTRR